MRLIIQRVKSAKVTLVETQDVVGSIEKGLFILVGIKKGDTDEIAEELAQKVAKLRIMADGDGKMNLTVEQAGGHFLVVSQFTLYADTSGGNRPSFVDAAPPEEAERIYDSFVAKLKSLTQALPKKSELRVETGSFGKYMSIVTDLDGPVTILLE